MTLRVGIVGCGLIGQKRARALGPAGRVVACADPDEDRARAAAVHDGARVFSDWRQLVSLPDVDVVVVATPHDTLAPITLAAVEAGKHVLVEKPAARSPAELKPVIEAAQRRRAKVHVGFNHRYHRSFRKAREIFESGALGELMFVRARYGHGGRIGYDQEWRARPEISGGGELIDQGPHLIDLARWFLGDFSEVQGFAHTYYWSMPVDDNGFMLLKTPRRQVAFLHASCTEWKNLFSMEIYGREGKLDVSGLGGSYGVERLTWYRMLPQMGPPETAAWEYPMDDDSWEVETAEFLEDIRLDRTPQPGLRDAAECLKIIQQIYRESGLDHRA
ncbi:MAG TPA: Gfo/Idh/MocA family oxidoreductase [Burkholderiaceae bacterium]|nr:Gfo/Idh/MocA family oxidoreductase [Burkholderiaceae bacterium]